MSKVIFAASTGGHLEQLVRFADTMNASADSLWITFRSPQSESLLADRRVLYLPYIRPRDATGVLRGLARVRSAIRGEPFDRAISTGAAIALAVFPVTSARRIPNTYIESVSRVSGPSLTGKLVQRTRLASTWTQHAGWASKTWPLHRSVLSGFEAFQSREPVAADSLDLFVTLGTIQGYRFDSIIDRLVTIGAAGDRTLWQLGNSMRHDLPGTTVDLISREAFAHHALSADVVVTHAGVGTILGLLDLGVFPVVVPRRAARREHVDDHQEQIASLLEREGLGIVREADEVTLEDLQRASAHSTRSSAGAHA